MPRYVPQSGGWIEDDHYSEPAPQNGPIIADSHVPVETALLHPNGQPIMRLPNPIGFGRDSEW